MNNNLKYRIENKYGIDALPSWVRVENPMGYYETVVGLEKVNESEYEYRISGHFRPIINGKNNLLRKDIADLILKYVPEQIELKPIKIIRKSTGEFWIDYYELTTKKSFNHSEYDKIESKGLMIFGVESEIYFSNDLKDILLNDLKTEEVEFREGKTLFA
ncbi:hypothetical protein [Tenacibaculum halocynthiae]|uniref:hypothetical protein n=1 Tax=Tenacibaculum halocynthiae TaxID=1254437 RepID=UPI003894DD47